MLQNDQQSDANGTQSGDKDEEYLVRATRDDWEKLRPIFNKWAKECGEPLETFDEIVNGQVEMKCVDYQKDRAFNELEESHADWDQITESDVASLQKLLCRNPKEPKMHRFLEDNPKFLIQVLGAGHGRYQLSKKRLGSEFVPDFLVAEMSSIGMEWYAVEIESPRKSPHNKDGSFNKHLNHAINQIRDWREWLMNNIDYARRPKNEDGLGLVGIDPRVAGIIIIGRRSNFPPRYNKFRRQLIDQNRIVIHSYDWLVDVAQRNRSGTLNMDLDRYIVNQ